MAELHYIEPQKRRNIFRRRLNPDLVDRFPRPETKWLFQTLDNDTALHARTAANGPLKIPLATLLVAARELRGMGLPVVIEPADDETDPNAKIIRWARQGETVTA